MRMAGLEIKRFRTNLRRVYLASILLFPRPEPAFYAAGAGLVMAGVLFHFWASGYLTRGKSLVVSGPYRIVRNPFYAAAILIDAGFGIATRNWIAAGVFVPVIALVYLFRVRKEESDLAASFGKEYEDYRAYCPRRLLPCWSNLLRPPPGEAVPFSFAVVWKNREFGRALSHVSILLLAGGPFLFPQAWEAVPLWARGVALAALALLLGLMNVRRAGSEASAS